MKTAILFLLALVITLSAGYLFLQIGDQSVPIRLANTGAPTVTTDPNTGDKLIFKNYGTAPEFPNSALWLNSDPQFMAALRGKVVLINFWTYSCITCLRMLPQLQTWSETYKDQGLVVLGIHTPEYAFEKLPDNVQGALQRYHVGYPVAQDNGYAVWNGYNNQFWPATYLIDKEGKIVYARFGETHVDLTENAIQQLVALPAGLAISNDAGMEVDLNKVSSRILQFGIKHADSLASNEKPTAQEQVYTLPEQLRRNAFALEGIWKLNDNAADLTQGYGRIRLNFNGAKVKLTAQSIKPVEVTIILDGKQRSTVAIQALRDYELFKADQIGKHTLELDVPQAGFEAQQFIFE